ncbi:hypothetical protein ABIA00_007066 [Bradyrhizobium ottawaense]
MTAFEGKEDAGALSPTLLSARGRGKTAGKKPAG